MCMYMCMCGWLGVSVGIGVDVCVCVCVFGCIQVKSCTKYPKKITLLLRTFLCKIYAKWQII